LSASLISKLIVAMMGSSVASRAGEDRLPGSANKDKGQWAETPKKKKERKQTLQSQ
jgi:hypothetical protein